LRHVRHPQFPLPLWGCYVSRFNLLVLDLRCGYSLQDKQVHMSRNHHVDQSHVGLCKLPIENSSSTGACVEEMNRQPELWIHFKTPKHMYIVLSYSFILIWKKIIIHNMDFNILVSIIVLFCLWPCLNPPKTWGLSLYFWCCQKALNKIACTIFGLKKQK
jgi:hypothetical protein